MVRVDPAQLKFFAKSNDQRGPIFVDDGVARAAGYRAIPAPPTFDFSLANAGESRAVLDIVAWTGEGRAVLVGKRWSR
jgi:hypothetical protein